MSTILSKIDLYYLLFIVLILISSSDRLNAQPERIKSLKANIAQMSYDTEQERYEYIDSLNELAFLCASYKPDTIRIIAEKAKELSNLPKKYPKGLGDAHMRMGIYFYSTGAYQEAIAAYNQAKQIRMDLGNITGLAGVYNNIGLNQMADNQMNAAINSFKRGLEVLRNEPTSSMTATLYTSLADVHVYSGELKTAIIYADSSLTVLNKLNDDEGMARMHNILGNLNLDLRNFSVSGNHFAESLKLYEALDNPNGIAVNYIGLGNVRFKEKMIDEALGYYLKALAMQESFEREDLARLYFDLGVAYKAKKIIPLALQYFKKSQSLFIELDQEWQLADLHNELGILNYEQENFEKAKENYLQSIFYTEMDYDPYTIANVYYDLSETYSKLGIIDSALVYSQLHNDIRDSINLNRYDALGYQVNLKDKEKENLQLMLELEEGRKRRLTLYFLIGSLVLALLFLVYYFKNRQQRQLASYQLFLAEREMEVANQKVDDLIKNQELSLTYARLESKEATQKQIGQDLHDRIGIMLSTIKLYFNDFTNHLSQLNIDTTEKQAKAIQLLDDAVHEVRRISHNMKSGILEKIGLAEAVKDLAELIQKSNQIEIELTIHGLKNRMPSKIEESIFKIIQELLTNVLKHAKAKKITIYLTRQEDLLNLIVEDDGIGFMLDDSAEKSELGLKNIAYRVSKLDGKIHFDSSPEQGTSVIIDVPIPEILNI